MPFLLQQHVEEVGDKGRGCPAGFYGVLEEALLSDGQDQSLHKTHSSPTLLLIPAGSIFHYLDREAGDELREVKRENLKQLRVKPALTETGAVLAELHTETFHVSARWLRSVAELFEHVSCKSRAESSFCFQRP